MNIGKKGLSTDEKLSLILNGPDDPEDDEAILRSERRAKTMIRRTSLYGNGARFKVPKLKKPKLNPKSPFASSNIIESENMNLEKSAVPPGAHDEQYRMQQYNTEKNRSDPDRIWYANTSIKDGLRIIRQPAWYYGNANKTKPADASFITAAARYGFRGSKEIRQYHTERYEPPHSTTTAHTPKFLVPELRIIDEWVPPLSGQVHTTKSPGARFISPKMWPDSAHFVTGYAFKEDEIKSAEYKRQTTAGSKLRPKTTEKIEGMPRRRAQEDEELIDLANMETFNNFMSVPKTAQAQFRRSWAETLEKNANATLRQTMSQENLPFQAHRLMDPSDTMRYSGSTAMIVHTQNSDELKFRLRMERAHETIPYTLRWKQVMAQFKNLKQRLKRDQVMKASIMTIGARLRAEALPTGQPTILGRMEFIHVMHKVSWFEHTQPKLISLLYSTFDHLRKNIFRYVDILVAWTIIDCPSDSAITKLNQVWSLNEQFGNDRSVMEMALTVLKSCCGSDEDQADIEDAFKDTFRPAVYTEAILNTTSMDEEEDQKDDKKKGNNKGEFTGQPPYNICDTFLTKRTFLHTLETRCQSLLALFDDQLSQRLIGYYGKDSRRVLEEEEGTFANLLK